MSSTIRNFAIAMLTTSSLAQTFRDEVREGFYLGSQFSIPRDEAAYMETFNREFNIGTAEYKCKMRFTQPNKGDY